MSPKASFLAVFLLLNILSFNIYGQVTADFRVNSSEILTGESVTFTDQSTGFVTGWLWLINGAGPGGSTGLADSVQQNPVFIFNNPGVYHATLGVKDSSGSFVSWKTKTSVVVVKDPQDTFQVMRTCQDTLLSGPINLRMLSVELETPVGSSLTDWDIFERNPNGSAGNQLYEGYYNMDYQFNQGYFDWEHPPVRYFNQCQLADTGLIQIKTPNTAGCMVIGYYPYAAIGFNYSITHVGCFGDSTGLISFNSATGGSPPYEYTINGGDSWQPSDTFGFLTAGVYALGIRDANQCEGTLVLDSITEPAPLPAVSFSGLDTTYCANNPSSSFTGLPPGGVFSGTGVTGSIFDPALAGPGIYSVTYTITDSNGCTADVSKSTIVYPVPEPDFTVGLVCQGDSSQFFNLSSIPFGSLFYTWGFGDGNSSSLMNPSHLYTATGTYSVTLTATSSNGCTNDTVADYTVDQNITNVLNEQICDGDSFMVGNAYYNQSGSYVDTLPSANGCDSIVITNLTVLPVTLFNLQDSICSGDSIFLGGTFQTQPGIYTDTLVGANGCDSLISTTLIVLTCATDCNGDPGGTAMIDTCGVCAGGNTGLIPNADLDDCGICFGNNADKDCNGDCFGTAFTDGCGVCAGGNTGVVPNSCPPTAAFMSDQTTVPVGSPVNFTDLSLGNPTGWFWDFGDGGFDTIQNPSYTYDSVGIYNVMLIVSNAFGLDSTFNPIIVVDTSSVPCVLAILGTAFDVSCFGAADGFVDVTDTGGE